MNLVTTRSPNWDPEGPCGFRLCGGGTCYLISIWVAWRRRASDVDDGLSPLGVQHAAQDVVAHARKVLHPAARISTTECSCRFGLPGDVAHRLMPEVSRTLATLRSASSASSGSPCRRACTRPGVAASPSGPAPCCARPCWRAACGSMIDRRHLYSSVLSRGSKTLEPWGPHKHETAPARL